MQILYYLDHPCDFFRTCRGNTNNTIRHRSAIHRIRRRKGRRHQSLSRGIRRLHMEQRIRSLDLDQRCSETDTRHTGGSERTRGRNPDLGSALHNGCGHPKMAGIQSDMGVRTSAGVCSGLLVRWVHAKQVHQYKTTAALTAMSHTILKSTNPRRHTLLDEVSGRIEVLWEQLTRRADPVAEDDPEPMTQRILKRQAVQQNNQYIRANFVFE